MWENLSPATAVSAAPEKKRAVKASVVAVRRMRDFGWGVSVWRGGAPPNSQLSLCEFRRGIAGLLLRFERRGRHTRADLDVSVPQPLTVQGVSPRALGPLSLGRGKGRANHQNEGSAGASLGSMIAAEIDQFRR
jgi:hypothetical protein